MVLSRFGEKEEYMLFMNDFLQQHWDGMRTFLQTVSSVDSEMETTSFDGYVDLPLRLAVLHGLLVDIIYQKQQVGDHSQVLPDGSRQPIVRPCSSDLFAAVG